jgi:hypothetical protein
VPGQGADRPGQGGALADQGELQLDHALVLDPEPDQARGLEAEVGPPQRHAPGHLDGGAVPAGLQREHHRASDAMKGELAGQLQRHHPAARHAAQGDRPGEREGGRGEPERLQPVVSHAAVAGFHVGPQRRHVHGHLGGGQGAAGDDDRAADVVGAADHIVGGRDRAQPLADPVADKAVLGPGDDPLPVRPPHPSRTRSRPQPRGRRRVTTGQQQPAAAGQQPQHQGDGKTELEQRTHPGLPRGRRPTGSIHRPRRPGSDPDGLPGAADGIDADSVTNRGTRTAPVV